MRLAYSLGHIKVKAVKAVTRNTNAICKSVQHSPNEFQPLNCCLLTHWMLQLVAVVHL